MKSEQPIASGGRSTRGSKPSADSRQAKSPYITAKETNALLKAGLAFRTERLTADDMVTTDGAAELAGNSRVTINAWIKDGRCIGLTRATRGYRLPAWQFEPPIWNLLPALSKALGTTNGWSLLEFLETPSGALGGRSPRSAIEQGKSEQVLAIAAHGGN